MKFIVTIVKVLITTIKLKKKLYLRFSVIIETFIMNFFHKNNNYFFQKNHSNSLFSKKEALSFLRSRYLSLFCFFVLAQFFVSLLALFFFFLRSRYLSLLHFFCLSSNLEKNVVLYGCKIRSLLSFYC